MKAMQDQGALSPPPAPHQRGRNAILLRASSHRIFLLSRSPYHRVTEELVFPIFIEHFSTNKISLSESLLACGLGMGKRNT